MSVAGEPVLPDWADAALSGELGLMAAIGETQEAEFKAELPKQVSDLAKEIAGFATSNAGRILLGIGDDGTISGLADCMDRAGRAALIARIEGLCANAVRPAVTPKVRFAVAEGRVVVVIDIPKGTQPVYYSANIPYLRQITAARPMAPDEVVEHVLAWHKARGEDARPTPESRYLGELAGFLVEAEIDGREVRIRRIKPWTDMLRSALGYHADRARELAASAPDSLTATQQPLEAIAEACEEIARERPTLNSSRLPIEAAIDTICDTVQTIRARWLGPELFSDSTHAGQRDAVRITARQLAGLVGRIDAQTRSFRMQELQDEASARGRELLRAASYGIGLGDKTAREALWEIGAGLRELETRRLVMDGGKSQQRLMDDLAALNDRLQTWLGGIAD